MHARYVLIRITQRCLSNTGRPVLPGIPKNSVNLPDLSTEKRILGLPSPLGDNNRRSAQGNVLDLFLGAIYTSPNDVSVLRTSSMNLKYQVRTSSHVTYKRYSIRKGWNSNSPQLVG